MNDVPRSPMLPVRVLHSLKPASDRFWEPPGDLFLVGRSIFGWAGRRGDEPAGGRSRARASHLDRFLQDSAAFKRGASGRVVSNRLSFLPGLVPADGSRSNSRWLERMHAGRAAAVPHGGIVRARAEALEPVRVDSSRTDLKVRRDTSPEAPPKFRVRRHSRAVLGFTAIACDAGAAPRLLPPVVIPIVVAASQVGRNVVEPQRLRWQ